MVDPDLLVSTFCHIDDFCQAFEANWQSVSLPQTGRRWVTRTPRLSLSEVMTLLLLFPFSGCKTFKHYYTRFVLPSWGHFFPKLLSYNRFVEVAPFTIFPLFCFLKGLLGTHTGQGFIDSTALTVCHIARSASHRTFKAIAKKGKSTLGWFFGMKLHLVINDQGEILTFKLTPGNTDDRDPVPDLTEGLVGSFYADRGYVSQALFEKLFARGIHLFAKPRKNMKNKLISLKDKAFSRARGLIECVFSKLKCVLQIEHHRHRSIWGFVVHLLSAIAAYCLDPKKPSLRNSPPHPLSISHL